MFVRPTPCIAMLVALVAATTLALRRLKDATERHQAALKQLEDFDHIISRVRGHDSIPVTSWEIAVDHPDMRYEGGLKLGGRGDPRPRHRSAASRPGWPASGPTGAIRPEGCRRA